MAITFYRSTDASAPSLTGATGSLVALLDAILVNGYGAKSAAGWTIAYTATNKRDYKQGSGSNGYYLDVDDSAPTTAKEARMRGYETMSALATGTNPFPTTAQLTAGVICRKSNTADSTTRPWYCVADATCFHLFVDTGDFTAPNYALAFSFGDFFSYLSGDTYNTMINGRNTENSSLYNYEFGMSTCNYVSMTLANCTVPGCFVDRSHTGVGGSVNAGKLAGSALCGAAAQASNPYLIPGSSQSMCPYPNGPDGALELAPMLVVTNGFLRGYMKGLWAPGHNQPLSHTDTVSGTGGMSGKSFIALNITGLSLSASQYNGQIIVETSNTWS